MVTAEDESGIYIWYLRMPKIPVFELPGHAHCGGTDSAVNLWFASAASDDSTSESFVESPMRRVDPIHTVTMKTAFMLIAATSILYLASELSLTAILIAGHVWSYREPWIFASLSYEDFRFRICM